MLNSQTAAHSLEIAGFGCMRNGRVLLRHIDFKLAAGHILQLKGSNGSGKSTLLRSLAGLMPWRAGTLFCSGQKVLANSPDFQQQLAYLGHQCAMSEALSGLENLRFALQLQGTAWQPQQVAAVLQALDVADVAQRLVGRLSQGQCRRLALARVLLSERALWLLDEPDNALDVQGSAFLSQALAAHARAGGMAVVVSHRGLAFTETLLDTPLQVLDLSAAAPVLEGARAC